MWVKSFAWWKRAITAAIREAVDAERQRIAEGLRRLVINRDFRFTPETVGEYVNLLADRIEGGSVLPQLVEVPV